MSLTSLDLCMRPGAPVWVQDLGPVCLPLSKCTVSIVPPWGASHSPREDLYSQVPTGDPSSSLEPQMPGKVISWTENSFSVILLLCPLTPGEFLTLSDPRFL